MIDTRVHYVGMTALRTISFDRLPEDEIYVLQRSNQPVAVLVPYALYMDMQQRLAMPLQLPSHRAVEPT